MVVLEVEIFISFSRKECIYSLMLIGNKVESDIVWREVYAHYLWVKELVFQQLLGESDSLSQNPVESQQTETLCMSVSKPEHRIISHLKAPVPHKAMIKRIAYLFFTPINFWSKSINWDLNLQKEKSHNFALQCSSTTTPRKGNCVVS